MNYYICLKLRMPYKHFNMFGIMTLLMNVILNVTIKNLNVDFKIYISCIIVWNSITQLANI